MSLNGLSETGGIVEAVGAGLSLSALGVLNADVLQSEVDAKQDTINPGGVVTDRAVVFNNAGNLAGVAGTCHPLEDRKFTIKELKRIMSLPEDFKLTGKHKQQSERIGRMVPPLMMKALAESVYNKVLKPYKELNND